MRVNELMAHINNVNFNLEKELDVKKYLPMEVKKTIAHGIIYDCTRDEGGVIKVDSVERYMSYVRYMITMYTNLEYTDDDYDTLCSTVYGDTTLLNAIMDCFGEDAKECLKFLDFMMDDYIRDNSIEVVAANFLNDLSKTIENLTNIISLKFDGMDLTQIIPENLDMEKLNVFLHNYIK
jgi:hypothetical protein